MATSFKEIDVHIEGISPLLMHSSRLANPLDPIVKQMKQITAKKTKKTESDIEDLAKLEYLGGLYVDANDEPIVPSFNIEGVLRDGARASRLGKAFLAGVFVEEDAKLIYNGPRTAKQLVEDPAFRLVVPVKVQKNQVMRTRPMFREWAIKFTIGYRPDLVNEDQVRIALDHAGSTVGLMDWRPKYGRFEVK